MSDTTPVARRNAAAQALLASWGRYLAHVRDKQKGLSQAQVAAEAGIDQTSVSRAEQGKGTLLGVLLLEAQVLGISVAELVAGAEAHDAERAEDGEAA